MTQKHVKKEKIRGGATGKGFDVLGQPSGEAKGKGRKKRYDIQNWIDKYEQLSVKEFQKLGERFQGEKTANKHTMIQFIAYKYVARCSKDIRVVFDRLDRQRGKAKQTIENVNEPISDVTIKIVKNEQKNIPSD